MSTNHPGYDLVAGAAGHRLGAGAADGTAPDAGQLVLRLAIDYLQQAQASGANVNAEATQLQQLLAALGAV